MMRLLYCLVAGTDYAWAFKFAIHYLSPQRVESDLWYLAFFASMAIYFTIVASAKEPK